MSEFISSNLPTAEAAVAEAQAACAQAAEELRLAIAAKDNTDLYSAEAQFALAQQMDTSATARIRAAELYLRGTTDVLKAAQLNLESLQDPASMAVLPQVLTPLALDPESITGDVRILADGKTIVGSVDHGNILSLRHVERRAQFFEWRATGHTFAGLTSNAGPTCPGCSVQGTIVWGSNGMLHNHLFFPRDDRQIEGYLGDGVRAGMLVDVDEGRIVFLLRTHKGPWRKAGEAALPRAAYRVKFSVCPDASIEVLGVRHDA